MDARAVRKVLFASSLGTVFEWYDFYLYATLAPFFAALFFPQGNETAALLASFATYAAGFLVRPFGAIVFGRIGDLVGRKYTFLVTILIMGLSTAPVGVLPTLRDRSAWPPDDPRAAAPGAGPRAGRRVRRRGDLCRRARARRKRGYTRAGSRPRRRSASSCRWSSSASAALRWTGAFKDWGWRVPFLVSLVLLGVRSTSG